MSGFQGGRGRPPGAREIRQGDRPAVSIVIASSGDAFVLDACLSFLLPACREHGVEIVVARSGDQAEWKRLEEAHRAVHFVGAIPGSTDAELRAAGMAAAEGDIVLLTDDHHIASRERVMQLLRPMLANEDWPGQAQDELRETSELDWQVYFAQLGLLTETEDADHVLPGAGGGGGQ